MFESLEILDEIKLNFNDNGLAVMNISIAFIMFGVALGINSKDFIHLLRKPKPIIIGMISQIIILPLLTFLLIFTINPSVGVSLGMLLVASCPGGNISNFIASLAKGNTELSISLTAVSTSLATVITPFNFAFWGGLYISASPLLRPISIDTLQMFKTVFILLGLPLLVGFFFKKWLPLLTIRIAKPIRSISLLLFAMFVIGALSANFSYFLEYIGLIFIIVLLHNGIGFLGGYLFSKLFRLTKRDCRTVSIETGIQNSGLALALIFNPKVFPGELATGGMAFIAAWWGIWHIIAGLSIAFLWNYRSKNIGIQLHETK